MISTHEKLTAFYKAADEHLQKVLNEIDKKDTKNLATCAEYAAEIFAYLRDKEESMYAKDGFLKNQVEVNDKLRAGTIEWMVETQMKFKLENETLFLAVNIFDRFLEKERVLRHKLPLLATTAMLIAAKYEEIYPPHLKDFLCAAEKPLNRDDMLRFELTILQELKFDISIPTVLRFLQRLTKLGQFDETAFNLALYLCEFQLLDSKMAKYSPSLQATTSLYLAQRALTKQNPLKMNELPWKDTKHTESEILGCAKDMIVNMQVKERVALSNIRRKYAKYKDVIKVSLDSSLAN